VCLPLTFWTLLGMEVGLLALLTSLAMLLAFRLVQAFDGRDLLALAAVLAAAVLVRTDQVVLCVVVLGFLGWRLPARHRVPALATLGVVVAAALGGHTAFRLAYYGDPLPNTYYLKVLGVSPPCGRRRASAVATWRCRSPCFSACAAIRSPSAAMRGSSLPCPIDS
jgi:hypothetical protein